MAARLCKLKIGSAKNPKYQYKMKMNILPIKKKIINYYVVKKIPL